MGDIVDAFFPYRREYETHREIPAQGVAREDVLAMVDAMATSEDAIARAGRVSGSIYSGDQDHYAFLTEASGASRTPTCCSATCTRARRSSRPRSSR